MFLVKFSYWLLHWSCEASFFFFFPLLYCFMAKSSKGHLLLLVYLQWVLIYGELCWKSVCATQVYLNSITAFRMPFPFWLPVVTEKLSKLFAFSEYVVKLDIYDIIKHYLKANKRRLYRQNGILWVKKDNSQVYFSPGMSLLGFVFYFVVPIWKAWLASPLQLLSFQRLYSFFRMVRNRVKEKFLSVFTNYADGIVNIVGRPKQPMHTQFSGDFYLFFYLENLCHCQSNQVCMS